MSSETENAGGARVNDRRRFDQNGNPRETESEAEASVAADQPEQRAAEEQPVVEGAVAEPAPDAGALQQEVQELKQKLEAAYRRIDELARAFQASERDREAFKERLTRERERMMDVEKGKLAQPLFEAIDELDLSLAAADDSPLAQGVKMIRDGMLQKLGALGVERVEVLGRPFDPNVAEAVDMEITPNADEDQHVVAEIRAAYRLKDRVIREGRVKVAKYVPPANA